MFDTNVYHDKNKIKQVFAGVIISVEDSILLGFKKRGFGSGLWNHSFAGKVEKGEEIIDAAKRELEEESGLKVETNQLHKVGYFEYEFTDLSINSKIMEMHIYKAEVWSGKVEESSEMTPRWWQITEVPYQDMWADNSYWLDQVLRGEKVQGYFLYSGMNSIARAQVEIVDYL